MFYMANGENPLQPKGTTMNRITKKAKTTKNFVYKHRVAIAVTATSAIWMKALINSNAQYTEFLKENGLYEKFWTTVVQEDLAAM